MNKTETYLISPATGRVYTANLERKTRRAFREYMNPASAYEREYFQVNVYADGEYVNFGFVDDASDVAGIEKAIREVMNWKEAPLETFAGMHSRFD